MKKNFFIKECDKNTHDCTEKFLLTCNEEETDEYLASYKSITRWQTV